jgi:hypothetical protein
MYQDPARWAYLFQSYVLLTMMEAHDAKQVRMHQRPTLTFTAHSTSACKHATSTPAARSCLLAMALSCTSVCLRLGVNRRACLRAAWSQLVPVSMQYLRACLRYSVRVSMGF